MEIDKKAYNYNKIVWHEHFQGELHHIFGGSQRRGAGLCCLKLFSQEGAGHHNNWERLKKLKDDNVENYFLAVKNFDTDFGCSKKIFKECGYCYFFTQGRSNGKEGGK